MLKVSVIIPIYNVEQYLEKCLDSVIAQTYTELEIICVNDCSPDNCAEILEKYAKQDKRIKIVNRKKNGGLSAARNSGLDVAAGEYIYFIDSDDWIDLDYIEKMVEAIEKNNTDIVLNTNIQSVTNDEIKTFVWKRYSKILPQGEFLGTIAAINNSQCMISCHLYKRKFLLDNNLRFPEGYIHEDEYFQYVSKIKTDKIFAFFGSAYHYLQRDNSIMFSRKSKIEAYAKIFNLVYDFYKQNKLLSKDNRIKLYRLDMLTDIRNEQEFILVKNYVEHIADDFKIERMASFDIEKAIFDVIIQVNSYEEYKKKTGINFWAYYSTRAKLKRKSTLKVSVIIPVYKVEQYLRKCLDSVCGQTLEDIEIICVNDCSPDNSLEILQEYVRFDSRIKIINFEQNKGVAIARNTAMAQAKGEFIGFVDPDDWIDLNFYEKLYKTAKDHESDLVIGNIKAILSGKEIKNNLNIQLFKKEKVFYGLFQIGLYKRELLEKHTIKFTDGLILGEDRLLPVMASYYAQNLKFIDDVYYNQLIRDNSATKNISEKKINDYIFSAKLVLEFVNSADYGNSQYSVIFQQFWNVALNYFALVKGQAFNALCEFCLYEYSVAKNKELFSQIDFDILNAIKLMNIPQLQKSILMKQKMLLCQKVRNIHSSL